MNQLVNELEFVLVDKDNLHCIFPLAKRIWQLTYLDLIGQEQIDYMLPMMYSDERILEEQALGYQWVLIKHKGNIVGYLDFKLEDDNRVFLSKIYTDIEKQIKGLGRALMEFVITYAKTHKAKAIYLTVNKGNRRAVAFYELMGMRCIESKTVDIGGGYVMDDYIFQLEV
ncbi:GNAT family N-acetyltransferase [Myroides pelagicus]|uniref:GNAT family N-acetyltransferase n=1 Tax=Myroides pelagicus TaxID=270914 RepID=A0A7K1GIP1_9FLAO|nr:GNAT family N-acetyltransferase [Myroides pelagicus]MEC4113771.1 GNAT family N-acetyltransferase [Myroides pelagicus]MTH28771.1 GNAT family N-acetyltransferase [Myroides pelagicus]